MTTARKDTNPRDGGTRSTATAVGGTSVKSRSKVKLSRGKYQDSPEWISLGNGAGMKKHLMTDRT